MSQSHRVMRAAALAMAGCALASSSAVAQSNSAASAPPASNSDIGPGELSNFSLNGTVTRPADQPPVVRPPPATTPDPAPASTTPARQAAPPTVGRPATAASNPADNDLFRRPPTLPDASASNAISAAPPVAPVSAPSPNPAINSEGFSLLPWIVAMLAVAGLSLFYFGRQRRQHAAAGHRSIDIAPRDRPDSAPEASPRPAPAAQAARTGTGGARRPLPTTLMPSPAGSAARPVPAVQPKPDPIIPGGIVSTSLRPWIEVELKPDRALLDETGTAIAFEVTLFNSGSAAARDVTIEARLLNAGANQDVELSAFFTAQNNAGDPIPQIAPYARIPLRSAVRLSRAEIREYAVEGRKLFVPLIAINVRYRWSSGTGHSGAGFLVGHSGEGKEKLGPLRLDRGSRSWRDLGVRRYEKGLRS